MLRHLAKPVAFILLGGTMLWAVPQQTAANSKPAGQTRSSNATRIKPAPLKQKKQEPQLPPQPPPPPPTLEQMPAQPPQVSFNNGMLSITSQNSTLGDILTAVRRQTGAALELPPGAASERVAARLGPGQPKDVVSSLLNGSNFDYIILGSLQRPGGLDRIILSARQGGTGGAPVNAQAPTPDASQSDADAEAAEAADAEAEEDNAPERDGAAGSETNEAEPDQQQQQQQGQPYQPVPVPQAQPDYGQQDQGGQSTQPAQPQVKSPEELLRELQQMRQQQQNQQQQNQQQPPPQDTPNSQPQ